MPVVPTVPLNDGRPMPRLGFGVYRLDDARAPDIVGRAIRAGYRSIDTAAIYGNEAGVGRAVAEAEVDRDALFVTTKLWNDHQGRDEGRRAFDASLARLGLAHVDLDLIHWPCPGRDRFVETWKALIALRAEGRAGSIGVSNFTAAHLERIVGETGVVPAINQIELHPHFQQRHLREVPARHGIVTESWSPLGQGRELADPVLAAIAGAHGRSPARWSCAGTSRAASSRFRRPRRPRIAENVAVFDFALTPDEMARIDGLDRAEGRIGPDPETFG